MCRHLQYAQRISGQQSITKYITQWYSLMPTAMPRIKIAKRSSNPPHTSPLFRLIWLYAGRSAGGLRGWLFTSPCRIITDWAKPSDCKIVSAASCPFSFRVRNSALNSAILFTFSLTCVIATSSFLVLCCKLNIAQSIRVVNIIFECFLC